MRRAWRIRPSLWTALLLCGIAPAPAQSPQPEPPGSHDAWQAFMDAAAAATAEGDDETAAIALNSARALSIAEKSDGARAWLSDAHLETAYVLLGKNNSAKKIHAEWDAMRGKREDNRLAPFIDTAKKFGDAYLARRNGIAESNDADNEARRRRLSLAANIDFGARAYLLKELRPADKSALAAAYLDQGRSAYQTERYDAALQALGGSIALGDEIQARREKLRNASRLLSPATAGAQSMPTDLETDVGGGVAFLARDTIVTTYQRKGWSLLSTKPEESVGLFKQAIDIGTELLRKYGDILVVDNEDALLYTSLGDAWRGVCRARPTGAQHDACVAGGRAAFGKALDLFVARQGDKGSDTLAVAKAYAKFLVEIGAPGEAAEVRRKFEIETAD